MLLKKWSGSSWLFLNFGLSVCRKDCIAISCLFFRQWQAVTGDWQTGRELWLVLLLQGVKESWHRWGIRWAESVRERRRRVTLEWTVSANLTKQNIFWKDLQFLLWFFFFFLVSEKTNCLSVLHSCSHSFHFGSILAQSCFACTNIPWKKP